MKFSEVPGHPTCQQMYDALNTVIEQKWELLASGAKNSSDEPSCALCVISDNASGNLRRVLGYAQCSYPAKLHKETRACNICPLHVYDGKGCGVGSLYNDWLVAPRDKEQEFAKKVLAHLRKVKEHFFGDWPK